MQHSAQAGTGSRYPLLVKRRKLRIQTPVLKGDRQERLAAKEILREIDLTSAVRGRLGEIQRRHAEQCPGAVGVGGGDDRRIDSEKAVRGR